MSALAERCNETLERSWTVGERNGVSFVYTRPSPERYRWQWYWDSCFGDSCFAAITDTVSREGLREFYDPHDGRGMGAENFAWSALAVELLDPDDASVGVPK